MNHRMNALQSKDECRKNQQYKDLLPSESACRKRLELCLKFVKGEQIDGHKIYSLHEPDVLCISKGKEHKKYEFGNKVSIVRLWNGIIVGALSFRNEYDGHTIDKSLEQTERIYGRKIKMVAGDSRCQEKRRLSSPRFQNHWTQPTPRPRNTNCSENGQE